LRFGKNELRQGISSCKSQSLGGNLQIFRLAVFP
jgi:hypothetical protein